MTQPIVITGCEQEPHQHHWIGDTCSECGVAWNIWIKRDHERLKAKLQRAEAACAEMRAALETDALWGITGRDCPTELETRYGENRGSLTSGPNNCRDAYDKIKHALSTTCGQGWLSPEKVTELVGTIQQLQPAGSPIPGDTLTTVQWIVRTHLEKLRVLTEAFPHPELTRSNCEALRFHFSQGEPYGGIGQVALLAWLDSVAKGLEALAAAKKP